MQASELSHSCILNRSLHTLQRGVPDHKGTAYSVHCSGVVHNGMAHSDTLSIRHGDQVLLKYGASSKGWLPSSRCTWPPR
jgi:hypothetical protein